MLVITRRAGQRVDIGDGIAVNVLEIGEHTVRLGIEAPPEVQILRDDAKSRMVSSKKVRGA